MRRFLLQLLFAAGVLLPMHAYDDPEWDPVVLEGEFSVILEKTEPLLVPDFSPEFYIDQILDDAVYIFSSMIYGWRFSYTPQDSERGVAESFVLEPVHSIERGDPGLDVRGGRREGGFYIASLAYRLSDEQLPWYQGWDTAGIPTAGGLGESPLAGGSSRGAVEDSVRQALRGYLRPQVFNKPRRVYGEAVLGEVPVITVDAGGYRCRSAVGFRIGEIQHYEVY